jgi:hypothetical protein
MSTVQTVVPFLVPSAGANRPSVLARSARSLWRALERHGQQRAAAELQRLAVFYAATQPDLAGRLAAAASDTRRAAATLTEESQ